MNIDAVMRQAPVIPVLVIDQIDTAVPLAQALVAGGLRVLEVTLRTSQALAAIKAMAGVDGALVGVGTVTQPGQFQQAKDAGAIFAVTPGLTPALAQAAAACDLPLLPGVMTPSEVLQAQALGFNRLKFFPAEQAGGVAMLKALSGPLTEVKFCPTGGINKVNLKAYLALDNVICVGGSWVVPSDLIAAGDWAGITRLAAEAVQISD